MSDGNAQTREAVSFGHFKLFASERRLERDGGPVQLGGRALDILIALTERPSEVVSKRELIDRVWPGVTVDEGNLRFQVAALRKALGDDHPRDTYVINVPGRGYCFVAPVLRSEAQIAVDHGPAAASRIPVQDHRLPPCLKRMVGREDAVAAVAKRLTADRFVTIAGPGGIGKTTVAVSVAHALLTHFRDAVRFFDLGPLTDPHLVPSAIASALGLQIQSDDAVSALVAFLRDKRMLLILDS